MTSEEFDQYRDEYPTMTDRSMSEWHSRLYRDHPDQSHFNSAALMWFLGEVNPVNVVEIGGWDGEAAALGLETNPGIVSWENYEVCQEAVAASVCHDPRYSSFPVPVYFATRLADTLVASHSLEHMSDEQVEKLISTTDAKNVYVDAPLKPEGEDWGGTTCLHCLRMGWSKLHELFTAAGFSLREAVDFEIRWYTR